MCYNIDAEEKFLPDFAKKGKPSGEGTLERER
jgi:hypothetical protein